MKTYNGWTAKQWDNALRSMIEDQKMNAATKSARCREWRRLLEGCGDWEALPSQIKMNITFWANVERFCGPGPDERHEGRQVRESDPEIIGRRRTGEAKKAEKRVQKQSGQTEMF